MKWAICQEPSSALVWVVSSKLSDMWRATQSEMSAAKTTRCMQSACIIIAKNHPSGNAPLSSSPSLRCSWQAGCQCLSVKRCDEGWGTPGKVSAHGSVQPGNQTALTHPLQRMPAASCNMDTRQQPAINVSLLTATHKCAILLLGEQRVGPREHRWQGGAGARSGQREADLVGGRGQQGLVQLGNERCELQGQVSDMGWV
jgi:hypothetical protein